MPRDPHDIEGLSLHSGPMSMDILPAKYTHALERNQKLQLCCRHTENIEARFYLSPSAADGKPDIMIAVCKTCGRRHRRMAAGGIKITT